MLMAEGLDPILEDEEDMPENIEDTPGNVRETLENAEDIYVEDEEPPLSPSIPNSATSSPAPVAGIVYEESLGIQDEWVLPLWLASPATEEVVNVNTQGKSYEYYFNSDVLKYFSLQDERDTTGGLCRRQKRRLDMDINEDNTNNDNMCQDDGCSRIVADIDLLHCKGLGCGSVVRHALIFQHLLCLLLYFSIISPAGDFQRSLPKIGTVILIVRQTLQGQVLENGVERRIRG